MTVARKLFAEREGSPLQPRREPIEIPLIVAAEITSISAEKLVSADTRQDYRHVAAGEFGHQVGGDERRVRDGLVHVPQESRQKRNDIGLDDDLVVVRTELLRHLTCIREFVVEGFGFAASESDGIGLDGLIAMGGHKRNHGARIDSPRQECADGNVAHHLHPNRFLEACADSSDPLAFGREAIDCRRDAPIPPLLQTTVACRQQRCRRQFANAAENGLGRGDIPEREIRLQCSGVQLAGYVRYREDRLGLAREDQPAAVLPEVERLDAEPVAADQKPFASRVPQSERIHAVQAFDERIALGFVEMENRFAIGVGLEAVPPGQEVVAKLPIVVNLAIGDEPQRAVLVCKRLVPTANVDDGKPAHSKRQRTVDVRAFIVGTAMDRELAHRAQRFGGRKRAIQLQDAVNAAHELRP